MLHDSLSRQAFTLMNRVPLDWYDISHGNFARALSEIIFIMASN